MLIATHDVEQARRWDRVLCLNRRQIAFGAPGRADPRVLEATYGGDVVRSLRRRTAPPRVLPPHHHDHAPTRDAAVAALLDGPVGGAADAARAARGRAARPRGRRARLLDRCSAGCPTAPSRSRTGCFPGSSAPRCSGCRCCSAARRARWSPRSRSRWPAGCRAIGRDTAVAVVVTTLFGLGVLLALSPATPPGLQGLLFGDVLGVIERRPGAGRRPGRRLARALRVLHHRLLAVGFDRDAAPRARRPAAGGRRRAAGAARRGAAGRRAGARQPAGGRGAGRPGRGRAPAHAADGADDAGLGRDRGAGRRRRALPLLLRAHGGRRVDRRGARASRTSLAAGLAGERSGRLARA